MSRITRRLAGFVASAVAATAVLLGVASPAQAWAKSCDDVFDAPTNDHSLILCAEITGSWTGELRPLATFYSGRNSTMATACNYTVWLELSNNAGQTWINQKKTSPCGAYLRWEHVGYFYGNATGTTATKAVARSCVDLYWNNSPYSGMQRCVASYPSYRADWV